MFNLTNIIAVCPLQWCVIHRALNYYLRLAIANNFYELNNEANHFCLPNLG